MLNVGSGQVKIQNCAKDPSRFIVARAVGGELWYWGSWDTEEEAKRVIHDNDFDNGVVIESTGGKFDA